MGYYKGVYFPGDRVGTGVGKCSPWTAEEKLIIMGNKVIEKEEKNIRLANYMGISWTDYEIYKDRIASYDGVKAGYPFHVDVKLHGCSCKWLKGPPRVS
jgi:hypothetical protein